MRHAETAAGMVRNAHQLEAFGFVPNGGRIYLDRSQPPTLSESVAAYLSDDFDLRLLREALPLEREYASGWRWATAATRSTWSC